MPVRTAPPWLIALVLVLGGAHWAHSLFAQQRTAIKAALENPVDVPER